MNFIKKHALVLASIAVIIVTLLFILGELSRKTTLTEITQYIPPSNTQLAQVAAPTDGLVAHYTFDDTTNDFAGSNNGIASGSPAYVAGKVGKALSFDGVDDMVKTPFSISGLNSFSVSLWVYERKDAHGQGFFSFQNGTPSRLYFGTLLPSGGPRISLGLSTVEKIIEQHLSLNTWEHYVVILDGTTVLLYHNGNQIFSRTDVTVSPPQYTLFLGCANSYGKCDPKSFFDGMLDDVRIYNKALSASEISALYALGGGSPPVVPSSPPPAVEPPPVTFTATTSTPTPTPTPTETQPPSTPIIRGDVVTALSCSQEHVQAALDAAKDGTIVQIPSGTCTWNKTVTANFNSPARSVIIQGAGIDQTVLIDEVPTVNTNAQMLVIRAVAGKAARLTGLTVKSSPNMTVAAYGGAIAVGGTSKQVRLDHIRTDITHRNEFAFNFTGEIYGVIDHVVIDNANQVMRIWHNEWDKKTWGDGSWASPLALGTEKAVYIEDSVLRNRVVTDAYGGGRYVVRYNTIEAKGIPVQNHGTDSSGRIRGAFSWEVYNNTVKLASSDTLFHMRSGTGVIFNNTMTGASYLTNIGTFNNYRNLDGFSPWATCDGRGPYDKNDGVVYDTGMQAAGIVSATPTLTVTDKNWTANQWLGYSLVNVTKNWGSEITGNTATTITAKKSNYGTLRGWDPGDVYQILRVDACIDQVGRSSGDLISSDYTNPTPKTWPHQSLEPVYLWGNVLNGVSNNRAVTTTYVIKKDHDFYEGIPRPGYTPYTYPHPLTTAGFTGDDPSKPLPPPATPAPLSVQPTPIQPAITPKTGDFNNDGRVNALDFSLLSSHWNQSNSTYDLNADGTINSLDYVILVRNWTG